MKKLIKMFVVFVAMIMFTIQVNGQSTVIDKQLVSNQTNINEVITSLKGLNNDNLTEIIGTLEKLSTEISEGYEVQTLSNSKVETLGRTDVQKLSSEEIVSVLDNAIFSINKFNLDGSYDSIVNNLREVTKRYEGNSYKNLRENIKE